VLFVLSLGLANRIGDVVSVAEKPCGGNWPKRRPTGSRSVTTGPAWSLTPFGKFY